MDSRAALHLDRRTWLAGSAAVALTTALPLRAIANATTPYDRNESPPSDSRAAFVQWMQARRGEDPKFLGQRFDRFQVLLENKDIWDKRDIRAYLLTPREEFVTKANLGQA